jgi:hypothetical protein
MHVTLGATQAVVIRLGCNALGTLHSGDAADAALQDLHVLHYARTSTAATGLHAPVSTGHAPAMLPPPLCA